ncbi:hypothetical protein Pint_20026 [Pistacia integerrima]|uniref:Uncharacterized protein n=1 Tax=Pistacia integerrima TaxID=434235 RepID=A0ACC0XER8_9ROSI|nr:hypothetical protein Pint_20026 [Pistacia integerrima]
MPTIKRPQEKYNILVNKLNQPFQHVWLQRSEDNQRFLHPLESLSVLQFVDKDIVDVEPVKPTSLEETPFKLVEEVKDLKELAAKLWSVNEFAASTVLKLERNSLEYLLWHFCGVTANKEYQNADWRLRPHPGEMLRLQGTELNAQQLHPYIERNLGSLVSIIRDSQNATAFEAIAQQLKEGRMEIASEVNLALNDETEALVAETSTNVKNSNVIVESVGGGNAFNASIIPHLPPSWKFGSSVTKPDRKGLGSLGHPGTNGEEKESGIHISELPRESILTHVKVTEASVRALKKLTRGFGAPLGNPKRKFDTEKKASLMCSLFLLALQLFCSSKGVNLPFHSSSARDEQPKAVKEVKVEPLTSSKNLQSLSSFTSGEQPKPVAEESKVLEVQSKSSGKRRFAFPATENRSATFRRVSGMNYAAV